MMERSILNVKLRDKVRNNEIREKSGIRDTTETVGKLKIKYEEHISGSRDDRWVKMATEWTPYGRTRERVGRQNDGGRTNH